MPGRTVRPGEASGAADGRPFAAVAPSASGLIALFFMSRDPLSGRFASPQYHFGGSPFYRLSQRDEPGRSAIEEGRRRAVRNRANVETHPFPARA